MVGQRAGDARYDADEQPLAPVLTPLPRFPARHVQISSDEARVREKGTRDCLDAARAVPLIRSRLGCRRHV